MICDTTWGGRVGKVGGAVAGGVAVDLGTSIIRNFEEGSPNSVKSFGRGTL